MSALANPTDPSSPASPSLAGAFRGVRLAEVIGGGLLGVLVWSVLAGEVTPAHIAHAGLLGALLLSATAVDIREHRIPNGLTAASVLGALVLFGTAATPSPGTAILAAMTAVLAVLAIRILGFAMYGAPGMGVGDAKLLGALGLLLGWTALWAFYLAVLTGGLIAMTLKLVHRSEAKQMMPFAPCIALGAGLATTVLPFDRVLHFLGSVAW